MLKPVVMSYLCVMFAVSTVWGQTQDTLSPASEALLLRALHEIEQQRLDSALRDIEVLVQQQPTFRLAQLIYGDLLLAQTRPLSRFGELTDEPAPRIADLRREARARWQHAVSRPPLHAIPRALIQLPPSQRHAVVVDLAKSRLYLFANRQGVPRLIRDHYVSIGKNGAPKVREGDRRTPVGVYVITGHLLPRDLPDLYGAGAFPINYPNEWDRRLGKTGYGIWLHGVPSNTYSRPPQASDGCVALSNPDLQALEPFLDVGQTPVVLAQGVEWVDPQMWRRQQEVFGQLLRRWRQDWESRDPIRYLRHYSKAFTAPGMDYAAWARHKRRVNARKRFVRVRLSDVSLQRYPGEADMVVATFWQDYRSDTFRDRMRKRQYWRREADGVWRIVYEGPA